MVLRSPASDRPRRQGFTLIELLVVISIICLLMGISVPAVLRSVARAQVGTAIGRLEQVALFAQRKAQDGQVADGQAPESAPHFGVALYAEAGQWYATVTYGLTPTEGLAGFTPVQLGRSFELWTASDDAALIESRLDGRIGWFYQYGSGFPILAPGRQSPQAIGTPYQAGQGAAVTGTLANQSSLGDHGRNFQIFGTALEPVARGQAADAAGHPCDCSGIRLRFAGQGPPLPFAAAFAIYPIGMTSVALR